MTDPYVMSTRTRLLLQFSKFHTHPGLSFNAEGVAVVLAYEYARNMSPDVALHHVLMAFLECLFEPRYEMAGAGKDVVLEEVLKAPYRGFHRIEHFMTPQSTLTIAQLIDCQIGDMLGKMSVSRMDWIKDEEFRRSHAVALANISKEVQQ